MTLLALLPSSSLSRSSSRWRARGAAHGEAAIKRIKPGEAMRACLTSPWRCERQQPAETRLGSSRGEQEVATPARPCAREERRRINPPVSARELRGSVVRTELW